MSNASIDSGRHDRIHMYVDGETYARLEAACKGSQMVDELVEEIVSDESKWLAARDQIKNRTPVVQDLAADDVDSPTTPPIKNSTSCSCCPGRCRCPFPWRGKTRCGCTPERLAFLAQNGTYLK